MMRVVRVTPGSGARLVTVRSGALVRLVAVR